MSLVAMMLSVAAFAQSGRIVTGDVVDEFGDPIIGATVRVDGTTTGTVTDIDGNFSVDVPAKGSITVSFIGYISQTISDFKQKPHVILKEDNQQLEEVVVVGYGVQKKAHLTGSVASISQQEIADIPTSNVGSALSGLVNGLSVSGGDTRPGSAASLSIRGAGSVNTVAQGSTSQTPLYVIDGFILDADAFNNLDPSTIEQISVLKDASAAVYGSRAANGVILVTTKKGKVGEPKISYSGNVGITDAVSTPKMLSAQQFGRLYNITRMGNLTDQDLNLRTDIFQADELEAMAGLDYNLLDKYWQTGITQQHSINLSGATEKSNYYGSVSYVTQDGNLGKLDYGRWNFRAGSDYKFGKYVKAGLSLSGDYTDQNAPLLKVQQTSSDKDYMMLLSHPGYIPEEVGGYSLAAYGITNEQLTTTQGYNYGFLQNSSDYKENNNHNFYINSSLDVDFGFIKPLKGLTARVTYSKSISDTKSNEVGTSFYLYHLGQGAGSGNHLYTPITDAERESLYSDGNFVVANNGAQYSNGTSGGHIERRFSRSDKYQLNFTLQYQRDFGKHSVNALFSIERTESETENSTAQGTQQYEFSTGQSNSINTDAGGVTSSEWQRSESGTLSYVGRLNYAYGDKYLAEFLMRSDASTKFHPDNYWGFFPSGSIGWVISKEKWMEDVSWIDFLKLRGSFGLTGRDNISAWQWMQTYSMTKDKGGIIGENSAAGSHIELNNGGSVNPDVHWDKSYKANFGIDFNTLQNRLGINIDGYYTMDREMLTTFSGNVPSTVGTSSASTNWGEMDSYGIELSANWNDHIGKNFKYKVGINTGLSDNKILAMDWPTSDTYRSVHYGSRTDMGIWGYECIGMFRSYQDIEEYFNQLAENREDQDVSKVTYCGLTKDRVRPGMLIYKDVRGELQPDGSYSAANGVVDSNDYVQISKRSSNPYHFTVNASAEYKDWSVSFQVNASWGGYSILPSSSYNPSDGTNSGWKYLEYINMPSYWNPDDVFNYNDIYDASGNLVAAQNRDAWLPNMNSSACASVNTATSTFWRVSSTRVTLNRMTIAYRMPKKVCDFLHIGSLRINVTGQNLLSFYNPYPDNFVDPMTTYGSYPTLRKFSIGLNLNF